MSVSSSSPHQPTPRYMCVCQPWDTVRHTERNCSCPFPFHLLSLLAVGYSLCLTQPPTSTKYYPIRILTGEKPLHKWRGATANQKSVNIHNAAEKEREREKVERNTEKAHHQTKLAEIQIDILVFSLRHPHHWQWAIERSWTEEKLRKHKINSEAIVWNERWPEKKYKYGGCI